MVNSAKDQDVWDKHINTLTDRMHQLDFSGHTDACDTKVCVGFTPSTHWEKMELACKAVSKECTKLAVAYSKEPEPSKEDSIKMLRDLDAAVDILQAWITSFPHSQGQLVRKNLIQLLYSILNDVRDFVESVKSCGCTSGSKRLTTTGTVWEKCETIATLPKDNCAALVKEVESSFELVSDALSEIEAAISEASWVKVEDIDPNDNDDEVWNPKDKNVLHPAVGLLKACKNLLKKSRHALKVNGNCSCEENISQLDTFGKNLLDISPCADDVTLSLYPPLTKLKILPEVEKLYSRISILINSIRYSHFVTEEDSKWITIISTAVQHNYNKILEAMSEE